MQVTAKERALIIARVCERLASGQSLKDACALETKGAATLKPSTFMLWVRRYGRDGDASEDRVDGEKVAQHKRTSARKRVPYNRMLSSKSAVLGGSDDWITLGGVGTSFRAHVWTKLIAEFSESEGIELYYRSSSFTAWIADSGRVTHEVVGSGLRSIEQIWEAVAAFGDPQYSEGVDSDRAADNAREAFPWLPEEIAQTAL
jgi:hypothetical protein